MNLGDIDSNDLKAAWEMMGKPPRSKLSDAQKFALFVGALALKEDKEQARLKAIEAARKDVV